MKSFLAVYLVTIALPPMAAGAELSTTIKSEAQKCANAVLNQDFDVVVAQTHPRIVTFMGGKESMITTLKRGMADMRANGSVFSEVTIGTPETPRKIGAWLTSIVPEQAVIKVKQGKLLVNSVLLGISEDEGRHWKFIDLGAVSSENFKTSFPELAGKIALPEKKPPVFKKD